MKVRSKRARDDGCCAEPDDGESVGYSREFEEELDAAASRLHTDTRLLQRCEPNDGVHFELHADGGISGSSRRLMPLSAIGAPALRSI